MMVMMYDDEDTEDQEYYLKDNITYNNTKI